MGSRFNLYFRAFRSSLFKNYDQEFNKSCEKLANEIENIFCIVDKCGNTKFNDECSIRILGSPVSIKYKFIFFEMCGSSLEKLFKEKVDFKNTNPSFVEFPVKDLNKKYVWLRFNFSPVQIGDELLVMVVVKDITKRRTLLEEFSENNVWSERMMDRIKFGIIMEDVNRTIISVNRKLIEIFNIDANPEDFIGVNCADAAETLKDLFVEPHTFIQSTNKIVNEKKDVKDEIYKLKNGQVIERSFFQLKTNLGESVSIWTYHDVTPYHELLNLVTEKEAKYRGILENTKLGVMEVSATGIILHVSEIFCQMSGYEREQLIGTHVGDGLLFDDATLGAFKNLLKNDKPESLQNYAQEFQLIRSKLWVLVSLSPTFDAKNQVINYTCFFYNITDRKKLEESLSAANIAAKKTEESGKFFLASMTHELKTPINAIVGMGDLLKLTPLNAEQSEYVEVLEVSTKYLQKLVFDILDISKIESGLIELREDPFNLMDLLHEIANTFDYGLAKRNIQLNLKLDFRPALEILGDKIILQQIIGNLLSNAEKFTIRGTITLAVEQIEENNDEIKLNFKVKDTGIGFNENMKDLIFEKFTQLPSLNEHKSSGTGLGLNIVKKLLAFKGSKVEVTSKISEGSVFSFDLIFKKNKFIKHISAQNKERNFVNPFNNLKILVVEDNDLNLQYLTKVLGKWSIDFDIATSGEAALAKSKKKKYNLVLLDLQLPGINGFDTALKLRTLSQNQILTIIAMTAVVTPNIEEEIVKYGMDDIIKKPFAINELYDKIALFSLDKNINLSSNEIPFNKALDLDFLRQFYNNDPAFALSVFETFKTNYITKFKTILSQADQLSISEIDFKLHSIKPAFKMVGLTDIEIEIEKFIIGETKDVKQLKQIFTDAKIASIETIIDSEIEMIKKMFNN